MSQDDLKRMAAEAAIQYVDGGVIGVGTGSTVNHFIDLLAGIKGRIDGAVSSSEASTERMKGHGIPVMDLNAAGELELYVDGADESNRHLQLIKGGGGALTREKIVAGASRRFVCIADGSKRVDVLGEFPLPVEVIPMARSFVARELVKLDGTPSGGRTSSLTMATSSWTSTTCASWSRRSWSSESTTYPGSSPTGYSPCAPRMY